MKQKNKVYLICGVSGSGKTWVCKHLKDKYAYVPNDEHYKDHTEAVLKKSSPDKPVITECPFGERLVKEAMLSKGLEVTPFFVITSPHLVAKQYREREGKEVSKAALTRAGTIIQRAREWKAFHGSAEDVVKKLQEL